MASFSLPVPTAPFVDKDGRVNRQWYQYLNNLQNAVGGGITPVTAGGTGLVSGVSGGILGFTAPTTIASSGLLTQYAIILGGGLGATPFPMASVGTSTQVLHGNATSAPTWGPIALSSDVSGVLPIANGGTNTSAALNNNRLMRSSSGAIIEASALTDGQIFIGSTGAFPHAAGLTASTGISIANSPGTIAVSQTGMFLVSTQTAASSASIDFTSGISSTYVDYVLTITDAVFTTANSALLFRVSEDGGATFKAGATDYAYSGVQQTDNNASITNATTASTAIVVGTSLSSSGSFNGRVTLYNPAGTGRHKAVAYDSEYEPNGFTISSVYGSGLFKLDTNSTNAMRIIPNSGFISTGTFSLYGIVK